MNNIKTFEQINNDIDPYGEEIWENFKAGQKVKYKEGKGHQRWIGLILFRFGQRIEVRWYFNNKLIVWSSCVRPEDIEIIEGEAHYESRTVFRLKVRAYGSTKLIGFFTQRADAELFQRRFHHDEYDIVELEVPENMLVFEEGEFTQFADNFENMSKKEKLVMRLLSPYSLNADERLDDDEIVY